MTVVLAATKAGGQGVVPTPTIQLKVVDESGNPIEKGRAEIRRLKRWAYVERGLATIGDLPQGTWVVAVSVPGFRPDSVAVETAIEPAVLPVLKLNRTGEIVLEEPDTVTFLPSSRDSVRLKEIATRMRAAHGTLLRYDHQAVRSAERATDALRSARGFRWYTVNAIRTNSGCVTMPRSDTIARQGTRTIAFYVDGNRTASALEAVNRMVPPRDILAIEAYPDLISAPARWRSSDACAVVAFWTKQP